MNDEVSFGQIIKEHRRARDLTQAELARRVACATITIRKIEADALRPSQQIAERLAMALGIPLEERAVFVRLARTTSLQTPSPPPLPTPPVTPAEIGEEDLTGRAIRGYELGERIGTGGFGVVYRAVQPLIDREVAIKIILPHYANLPDFIRRFEAEAQLVARLEHPHIVPLYDYWREPEVAYLVMRFLRGGDLQGKLKIAPLPLETVLHLLEQIGAALHTAHRAGVIHRDLKPANIMLDEDGNGYLTDFGIAKNLNLEDQTRAGDVLGSPAYFSPEQIKAEPIRPQTDIYSLGVMLYELLTGQKPFKGPTPIAYVQQHLDLPLPSLAEQGLDLPVTLDPVIQRATAKNPADRYPDILSLLDDFRQAVALPVITVEPVPASVQDGAAIENPFKGLRAFGEADSADFFGRATLVQTLLGRLAEAGDSADRMAGQELARFLAVVGPSGSGKSSVVRAGLVPALRQGGLPCSENWFVVEMTPSSHPLEELEAVLLRVAVNPPETLLAQLQENDRGLLRAVRRILPADGQTELVLVIDQFEELFTLCRDEAVRAHFMNSLVTAILDPRSRLRVIITLRADFIDRPLQYVDFGELVRQRTEFVLPLAPDELEEAIIRPAERVGLLPEPGLPETIIQDLGDQPGTLPLLQYTLTELFERRVGRALTLGAYQASGGVRGALASRADQIYRELDDAGQQAARRLFPRLITLGELTGEGLSAPDTRRRVLRSELMSLDGAREQRREKTEKPKIQNLKSKIDSVIDLFGRHRLLTFDRDPATRSPTVEVAHEALIREWGRLRAWLEEDREFLLWQQRLRAALHQWEASEQDEGALLRGAPLAEAENWFNQHRSDLSAAEQNFIQASLDLRERRAAEREAQRQRELETAQKLAETEKARAEAERHRAEEQTQAAGRLRQRALYLLGALIIAGILAVAAALFGQQARQNEKIAFSRELAAAAVNSLDIDPERGVLLALQALSEAHTLEAENALHQALPTLHILHTLTGHTAGVKDVAYSPDGKYLATASDDGKAILWEIKPDGAQELLNVTHAAPIHGITFSPDSKRFATGSEDGTAKIWDAATGQTLLTLTEQESRAMGYFKGAMQVDFSPDGTRLATANLDGVPKVWDATTGEELLALPGHTDLVTEIVFSPDGKLLATSGLDNTAKLWDATTGEELFTLSGHTYWVEKLAFSPDGAVLVTAGNDETAKVWDVATGQELFTLVGHEGWVDAVAFSPDGKRLATGSYDGTAKIWDIATALNSGVAGQATLTLTGHKSTVNAVAFSSDGKQLATASYDRLAKIWDTAPGQELLTLTNPDQILDVTYSPDGTLLASVGEEKVRVRDVASGETVLILPEENLTDALFRSVTFSPDGVYLAAGDTAGTVFVWNIDTGEELLTLNGHTNWVFELAFSPDGTRLATSSLDGTAKVWDVESGQELLTLPGHTDQVWSIAYSPDGSRLATGSWDDTVKIWDAVTGEELLTLPSGGKDVFAVAFSPDGTRLAMGKQDGSTIMWDATTGEELFTMSGHTGVLLRLTFSPDGTRLATASFDSTAKVWDATTGQEQLTLFGNANNVSGVVFSPDGTRLATSCTDKTVRLYVLPTEELVALARSRVTRSLTDEECQRFLHEACPAEP